MKKIWASVNAPTPIGPYSQAVSVGNLLFLSGQIAIDPHSGELRNADVAQEAYQVMANISALLGAAGTGFDSVVKTTIFLTDMRDFPLVNDIYGSHFSGGFPARETVQVAGLPKGVRIEISVIAELDGDNA